MVAIVEAHVQVNATRERVAIDINWRECDAAAGAIVSRDAGVAIVERYGRGDIVTRGNLTGADQL